MSKFRVSNRTFGVVNYKGIDIKNFIIVKEKDDELVSLVAQKLIRIVPIKDKKAKIKENKVNF